MSEYLTHAFDYDVNVEFETVVDKRSDRIAVVRIQRFNLSDDFVNYVIEYFNVTFDKQRVEVIESIGKFDHLNVFIEFGVAYDAFEKQRGKVAYRVHFIILDDFKRFYYGRERQNRFVDIEVERIVHEITYLRVLIQILKFGVNGIEDIAL